jgi:hypothetical protein
MAGNEMTAAAANFAPWQQRAYAHATDALDNGRMGHALLVCGPARLGKLAVAQRLAQRLHHRRLAGALAAFQRHETRVRGQARHRACRCCWR